MHLCNIALLGAQFPPTANEPQVDVQPYTIVTASSVCVTNDGRLSPCDEYPSGVHYGGRCVSTCAMAERALPYQEPGITALLTLSSFLYLLNIINHLLDKWIYCGLLGQVFVGVAWGMPGAQWISKAIQGVFTQLGFLGVVLLVYEGMIAAPLLHHLTG